jgi:hypothetical protein
MSVCWYRAKSNNGPEYRTLISIDVPSAPHPLLFISIDLSGKFVFEVGVHGNPDRLFSGPSGSPVALNIWTHLAFTQHVGAGGLVERRTLYLNGSEAVSSNANTPFYNPASEQVSAMSTSMIRALIQFAATHGYHARWMEPSAHFGV